MCKGKNVKLFVFSMCTDYSKQQERDNKRHWRVNLFYFIYI